MNHEKAVRLEKKLRDPVISKLVIVELYSVFSRLSDEPEPMVRYAIKRSSAELKEADLNEAAELSIIIFRKLRLKSLDLLYASLAKMIGANRFITFAEDIRRKGLHPIGIEVISE